MSNDTSKRWPEVSYLQELQNVFGTGIGGIAYVLIAAGTVAMFLSNDIRGGQVLIVGVMLLVLRSLNQLRDAVRKLKPLATGGD